MARPSDDAKLSRWLRTQFPVPGPDALCRLHDRGVVYLTNIGHPGWADFMEPFVSVWNPQLAGLPNWTPDNGLPPGLSSHARAPVARLVDDTLAGLPAADKWAAIVERIDDWAKPYLDAEEVRRIVRTGTPEGALDAVSISPVEVFAALDDRPGALAWLRAQHDAGDLSSDIARHWHAAGWPADDLRALGLSGARPRQPLPRPDVDAVPGSPPGTTVIAGSDLLWPLVQRVSEPAWVSWRSDQPEAAALLKVKLAVRGAELLVGLTQLVAHPAALGLDGVLAWRIRLAASTLLEKRFKRARFQLGPDQVEKIAEALARSEHPLPDVLDAVLNKLIGRAPVLDSACGARVLGYADEVAEERVANALRGRVPAGVTAVAFAPASVPPVPVAQGSSEVAWLRIRRGIALRLGAAFIDDEDGTVERLEDAELNWFLGEPLRDDLELLLPVEPAAVGERFDWFDLLLAREGERRSSDAAWVDSRAAVVESVGGNIDAVWDAARALAYGVAKCLDAAGYPKDAHERRELFEDWMPPCEVPAALLKAHADLLGSGAPDALVEADSRLWQAVIPIAAAVAAFAEDYGDLGTQAETDLRSLTPPR